VAEVLVPEHEGVLFPRWYSLAVLFMAPMQKTGRVCISAPS